MKFKEDVGKGILSQHILFILCAQILYLLIMKNIDIKGIVIEGDEYKMTQFADDTTLMLDGSRDSLQAASKYTRIMFGTMSGLKMNTSKTKLVWIGRKKYSKDKLNITYNLDWGITSFTLLGLEYSVNLEEMSILNFDRILENY